MHETLKLASARLRTIAARMDAEASTQDEEEMKKDLMEAWKKSFIEIVKKDPEFKGGDPEAVWREVQKAISVDIKRVLSARALPA